MADEKKEGTQHEQETIKPREGNTDELSEKDLGNASGGTAGHEKWISIDSFEYGA